MTAWLSAEPVGFGAQRRKRSIPGAAAPGCAYDEGMHRLRARDVVDVFVYTAVLAIFTEVFPEVVSESFLTSLVTAVLMKVVLELAVAAKARVIARFKRAPSVQARAVATAGFVIVAAGSKALILWLTDLVLGDAVHLGGFFSVTLLVVMLMLTRAGVRRLID